MPDTPSPTPDDIAVGPRQQDEAASRSLADALKVSFTLLKVAMVVLGLVYLSSGVFQVDQQNRAVRLIFGSIVGQGEGRVLQPGKIHFNPPYPIGEIIEVPVSNQTLNLTRPFWVEQKPEETYDQLGAAPLNPEKDGSLLTGDANIVLARYAVTWKIQSPDQFVVNVGITTGDELKATGDRLARAKQLVRNVVEQAVVHSVAAVEAEAFVGTTPNTGAAQTQAQRTLDALGAGIQINSLSADPRRVPPAVREAFQAVSRAESTKATTISAAQQEAARIAGQTAGARATDLLIAMIDDYEAATDRGDTEAADAAQAEIHAAFAAQAIPVDDGLVEIGGQVAQRLQQAEANRNRVVEQVKGEAQYFQALLKQYRQNPTILADRLWQEARLEVLSSEDVETFYGPTQSIRIDTGVDPTLERRRQNRNLEAAKAAGQTQR